MRLIALLTFAGILAALAAWPLAAAEREALLIANSRYEGNAMLRNPGNDADAMEAALKSLDFAITTKKDLDLRGMEDSLVAINPNIASSAVLSNRDSKQVVNVRPEPASSASAARAGNGGASGSAPAAGQYPVIDGATQRNRDASRARILQDELDNEQRALANARRMLQETERYAKPDSALLRGLRDSVLEREIRGEWGGRCRRRGKRERGHRVS